MCRTMKALLNTDCGLLNTNMNRQSFAKIGLAFFSQFAKPSKNTRKTIFTNFIFSIIDNFLLEAISETSCRNSG